MDRLILLRHGDARAPAAGTSDLQRPLTEAGRAVAAEAGRRLAAEDEAPGAVLVSPAVRTQQTWREASAAWSPPPPARTVPAVYEAVPEALLRLAEAQDAGCVMLVGHNPGLQALAVALSGDDGRPAAGFPPGSAAVVSHRSGGWRLVRLLLPAEGA